MKIFLRIIALTILLGTTTKFLHSQGLSVGSCPTLDKRNNGNGQYDQSPGNFINDPNTPDQNNPVAANVVGTIIQNWIFKFLLVISLCVKQLAYNYACLVAGFKISNFFVCEH
jgi:hypothetical protein